VELLGGTAMVSRFLVYRAACIFGLADAGLQPQEIKALEEVIASCFADELPVEEAVRLALSARVEAG
jgi:hypothetical protein